MELNYNFIAVPTNLYFSLDCNLRNALTVLLQLSSVFADSSGFFYRTIEDLKDDFKCGKNLTIAILESLYRYQLLQVKSVGFVKKNGKKLVNFYRVNVERFKDFETYNIYTITKNKELQLETVDYKAKDYKVTYTASTDSNIEPTDVQNKIIEEIPSPKGNNVLESLKTLNPDNQEVIEESEIEDIGELWLELQKANAPKIEYRSKPITTSLDDSIKQKCKDLVARYVAMVIPSSNESLEKCNKAIDYINKQYKQGFISVEDKEKLVRELIVARFQKHRI